jgi:drug/metabolite transporter (DMT)-like permease
MADPEPLAPAREDVVEAQVAGRTSKLAPNVVGALWMLGSAVAFTAMTTLIKVLGDEYPVLLQTFYRQSAGLVLLAPWILKDVRGTFRTNRLGILLFRSGAGTIAMFLAFYGYQELRLADANALSFTRTLWLVPLAAFVLREKLGPWRLGAALVGFMGVLLMLRPGGRGRSARRRWPCWRRRSCSP